MKKLSLREIAFLSLPVLFIGAVAFWRARVPSEPQELPPPDAETGPLRLEFGKWKDVPPSAGDVATGHILKKTGRIYLVGEDAKRWRQPYFYRLDANSMALEYHRNGQWHKITRAGGWNGIREARLELESAKTQTQRVQNQKFSLALPFALVPKDADEARLRGHMRLHHRFLRNGNFVGWTIFSPQINFSLWKKGKPWPAPQVNRTAQLSLLHLETHLEGEAVHDSAPNMAPYFLTARVVAQLDTHWKAPLWKPHEPPPEAMPQDIQLLDRSGHDWATWQPHEIFANVGEGWVGTLGNSPRIDARIDEPSQGQSTFDYRLGVSTRQIPRSAGEIRLKARVSLSENHSDRYDWPLTLETVVRPQWMTQTPRDLKLESVQLVKRKKLDDVVQKNGQEVDVFKEVPCVEAVLRYTGSKPLVLRGAGNAASEAMYPPGQMESDGIIAQIPFGDRSYGLFNNGKLAEAGRGEEELISSWSQRIEDAQGRLSKLFYDHTSTTMRQLSIEMQKPTIDTTAKPTLITVRYFLLGLKKQTTPLYFKAEIGLRNQGFLEIERRLP